MFIYLVGQMATGKGGEDDAPPFLGVTHLGAVLPWILLTAEH